MFAGKFYKVLRENVPAAAAAARIINRYAYLETLLMAANGYGETCRHSRAGIVTIFRSNNHC